MNEKCQMLMRKFDKESKANKRLSMDYEELMWRMSQSEGSMENLLKGASPTSELSSPVFKRKNLSPTVSEHSPARSPAYRRSISSNSGEKSQDKKWKRKSASYLMEENRLSPSRFSPPGKSYLGSDSVPNSPRAKSSGKNNRLSQSCNDADIFEGPQPLPSPVPPPELSSSLDSDYFTSEKTDSSNCDTLTTVSQSGDSISVTIVEKEKMNGVNSPETDGNQDDVSEISQSTDSCGVGSLVWDYENIDSSCRSVETSSCRSMESSVASDTILEANGHETSDQCTFSNSSTVEDISMPFHSPEKGGEIPIVPNIDSSEIESAKSVHNGDVSISKIPTFQGMKESSV